MSKRWRIAVGAGEVITVVLVIVGIIVWAVRLEGRVNAAEREIVDVQKEHDLAVQQFREDLAYIRNRIDAALAK